MVLSKQDKEKLYALQMNDDQLGKIELVLLLVVCALFYWWLRTERGIPLSLSLGYFYTTTILYGFRKILGIIKRY